MRVKEILDEKHPYIYEDELATKARALIRDLTLRILPVVDGYKKLLGVISRNDILKVTSSVSPIKVKGIMNKPKYTATINDDVYSAIKEMLRLDEWCIPVVESSQDKTYRGVLKLEGFIKVKFKTERNKLSKPVSEIMSKKVVTCTPEDEIDNVWRLMQEKSFAGLPVVKKDMLVGIVTQLDLLKSGAVMPSFESRKGRFRKPSKVSAVMKTNVIAVKPTVTVQRTVEFMIKKGIGRVPVKDEKGRLMGIIDREDVVKLLIGEKFE
ncbi:CBS domain-containing protein [Candidatus Bathyarchaeota archaeon]|nr:CBS domain-containing protein [Candidatus Bathyarchaeota archaeon]